MPQVCHELGVTFVPINNWCKKEYGESFSGVFKRKSSKASNASNIKDSVRISF
jgi:hypothetical protein